MRGDLGRAGGVPGGSSQRRLQPLRPGPRPWPVQPPRPPPAALCPSAWGLPGRSAAQSLSLKQRPRRNGPRVFIPPQGCAGALSSKSRFCKSGGEPAWSRYQCGSSVGRDQRDKAPLLHQGLPRTPGAFQAPAEVGTSRQGAVPTRRWCQAVPALPSASSAGSRCFCRIPAHGRQPRPAWMALLPQPRLPARQVTRGGGRRGTPMLGTPRTFTLESAGIVVPPASVVPGRAVMHKDLSPPGAHPDPQHRGTDPGSPIPSGFSQEPAPSAQGTGRCCPQGVRAEGQHREVEASQNPSGLFSASLLQHRRGRQLHRLLSPTIYRPRGFQYPRKRIILSSLICAIPL